jgi:hypothetical protein
MMLRKLIAVYFEKQEKPKTTLCAGGTYNNQFACKVSELCKLKINVFSLNVAYCQRNYWL